MDDVIVLHLPFPPSVNSYYARTRNGVFIKKQGKLFRESVIESSNEQGVYNLGLSDELAVGVILYPPDARIRDNDNYMKGLLDAITHAKVWEDDKQISQLMIFKGEKVNGGKCVVIIKEEDVMIVPNECENIIVNEFFED